MNRDSFGFYFFHFIGLASVIVAIAMGYWATFKINAFMVFMERVGGNFRDTVRSEQTIPWFVPERLWRILLLIFGFFGTCYLLYGGVKQLTSWFPYSWRNEEGDWTAIQTAWILCFFAAYLVWGFVGKIQKLLENGESAKWTWQYLEMANRYLLQLIWEKDEKSILFYYGMAYLIAERGGTNTQRQLAKQIVYGRERLMDPSVKPKASSLLNWLEKQVQLNKLMNVGALIDQLPKAPNGSKPHQSELTYENKDPITDQIFLEELVFWANETDGLDAMDEFFKTKAYWYPR
jgi:hypothetical protein